jgi:hypothetical protein
MWVCCSHSSSSSARRLVTARAGPTRRGKEESQRFQSRQGGRDDFARLALVEWSRVPQHHDVAGSIGAEVCVTPWAGHARTSEPSTTRCPTRRGCTRCKPAQRWQRVRARCEDLPIHVRWTLRMTAISAYPQFPRERRTRRRHSMESPPSEGAGTPAGRARRTALTCATLLWACGLF